MQSAATGSVVQTVVGNNADIVYTAGSTVDGQSGVEISGTTAATSAQLRIVGILTILKIIAWVLVLHQLTSI